MGRKRVAVHPLGPLLDLGVIAGFVDEIKENIDFMSALPDTD